MSLPHLLGVDIPAAVPYVAVDAERSRKWREEVESLSGRRKIGIVWAGRPTHAGDALRSVPFSAFEPLFRAFPRDAFLSLEGGEAAKDIASAAGRVADFSRPFADTAAIIEALDLVISVDTSIAHLAGALGRPIWTLLQFSPDFRWGLARDTTPWYPTMRLIRQPRPGDWSAVFDSVRERLAAS
jgi:ADP-heptose:LPS heptosyltransferase